MLNNAITPIKGKWSYNNSKDYHFFKATKPSEIPSLLIEFKAKGFEESELAIANNKNTNEAMFFIKNAKQLTLQKLAQRTPNAKDNANNLKK